MKRFIVVLGSIMAITLAGAMGAVLASSHLTSPDPSTYGRTTGR